MNATDLLSFIPLLLYGIALAELFSQWRRFFEKQYMYWPYVLCTVIFTEMAIYNIYLFFVQLDQTTINGYDQYWSILIQPIIFLLAVHAFTPEVENKDTEGYFKNRISVVFLLIAAYIGSHLIPSATHNMDMSMILARVLAIAVCIAIALSRYVPLVYLLGVIWFASLFLR